MPNSNQLLKISLFSAILVLLLINGCSQKQSPQKIDEKKYCVENSDCTLVGERCCGDIINKKYASSLRVTSFLQYINQECDDTCEEYSIQCVSNICTSVNINSAKNLPATLQRPEQTRTPNQGPSDHLRENQILVYKKNIIIEQPNVIWSSYTNTGSMLPTLNEESNGLEIHPSSELEIKVGDIISYSPAWTQGIIVHRVIETGFDESGWYALAKGDNNPVEDPEKVRFSQVEGIVIGVLY